MTSKDGEGRNTHNSDNFLVLYIYIYIYLYHTAHKYTKLNRQGEAAKDNNCFYPLVFEYCKNVQYTFAHAILQRQVKVRTQASIYNIIDICYKTHSENYKSKVMTR